MMSTQVSAQLLRARRFIVSHALRSSCSNITLKNSVKQLNNVNRGVLSSSIPLLHDQRARSFATLRRRRKYATRLDDKGNLPPSKLKSFGKLEEAYDHGEADMDTYLKKASLSPWVPVSDVVARKLMDLSKAGPNDIHVDLGSGDGRVNFQAIDYGVGRSIGIDVDEKIVQVARDRMAKRHPQPSNLEFYVADLMNPYQDEIWEKVRGASIITMYFAREGLLLLKTLLEEKLIGANCKILTVGYEMPGWQSAKQEVVLGTQIHLYEWGFSSYADDSDDLPLFFVDDDILPPDAREELEGKTKASHPFLSKSDPFEGAKIIDKTRRHPIRGYNPKWREYDKELGDGEDSDWDEEEDEEEEESSTGAVKVEHNKTESDQMKRRN